MQYSCHLRSFICLLFSFHIFFFAWNVCFLATKWQNGESESKKKYGIMMRKQNTEPYSIACISLYNTHRCRRHCSFALYIYFYLQSIYPIVCVFVFHFFGSLLQFSFFILSRIYIRIIRTHKHFYDIFSFHHFFQFQIFQLRIRNNLFESSTFSLLKKMILKWKKTIKIGMNENGNQIFKSNDFIREYRASCHDFWQFNQNIHNCHSFQSKILHRILFSFDIVFLAFLSRLYQFLTVKWQYHIHGIRRI